MKRLPILVLLSLLIAGCNNPEQIPRGVDESGVWKVKYFTDSFGDPTDEPYLSGVIDSGEYHHTGMFTNTTGNGRLRILYYLARVKKTNGKKVVYEDIPHIRMILDYRRDNSSNNEYYYSELWDSWHTWSIKLETEGVEPIIFDSLDLGENNRIVFKGNAAASIMNLLANGTDVKVRAMAEDSPTQDSYSIIIDSEIIKDLPEVMAGYRYHYFEYLKQQDEKTKSDKK